MLFYTQREKSEQDEKQASEQGKQGMQAGKVASWSVGSRALVVSAKGRNREWGKGKEVEEVGTTGKWSRKGARDKYLPRSYVN